MNRVIVMNEEEKKDCNLRPHLRFPEFRDVGVWDKKEISELLTISNGKDYKHLSAGTIPVYGTGGYMLSVNDYLYDGESVCIGRKGTIDKPFFISGKFWAVDTLFYTHKFNNTFPKFIFFCFQIIKWLDYNAASGVPSLTKSTIERINIAIPSYKEQIKIADCLSSLDERIASETEKLDTLKEHKKGLLKQLFPTEGETLPRLRFPRFRNAGKWQKIPLGDICDVLPGYTFPEDIQGKAHGQYPFCKVSDISKAVIEHGGLLNNALNYVADSDLSILKSKLLPIGTTIFAKIGEALRLNRRAITTVKCIIDNNAVGIKAKSKKITDYFLYILSQLIDLSEYCGGAVPAVSKTTLENIAVVIPGIEEQQGIADFLSYLDELITAQAQKIDLLKDHKKGLMQQLFPRIDEFLV